MASMQRLCSSQRASPSACSSTFRRPAPLALPRASRAVGCRYAGLRVSDIMSSAPVIICSPEDSVDTALELLVEHNVTGLPVLDDQRRVVGVVSDFDLLALDTFGSTKSADLFPDVEQTWQAFVQVRKVLAKGTGKRVMDVMTADPLVVRLNTNIDDVTSILITKKIRRLPVVDEEGRLLGLISRRDIVKVALEARKRASVASS